MCSARAGGQLLAAGATSHQAQRYPGLRGPGTHLHSSGEGRSPEGGKVSCAPSIHRPASLRNSSFYTTVKKMKSWENFNDVKKCSQQLR